MQSCPNCGAQISDADVFCGECGARVSGGPAVPTETDVAMTEVLPKRAARQSRPVLLLVIGGGAILVVLTICGVLAFILAVRSQETNEPVFLGGPVGSPTARTQRINAPTSDPFFEETFDDNSREWAVWEDEYGKKGVEDNVYYVVVNESEWASWGTSGNLTFDDFVVEVEARAVDGPDDNGYGLVFRYQDSENFYYYQVSSDGYYAIGKLIADEWETLVSWTESDLILLGRQTNVLRVECDDSRMTFFVNDYQIEELVDDDFDAGALGLMAEATAEPGVRVHFDNLRVWATE